MRELSFEDVQEVSGGSQLTDGLALILAGVTIAGAAGILTFGVASAAIISPFAFAASLGLSGVGGYVMGGSIPTVTISPDFGAGSDRQAEC